MATVPTQDISSVDISSVDISSQEIKKFFEEIKEYINNFDITLELNDLDNIVDNGVIPDDSYLDGKNSIFEKFLNLSSILKNPDNIDIFFERKGTENKIKFLDIKDNELKIPNWTNQSDIFEIGKVDDDPNINRYINFEYIYRLVWYKIYNELDINDEEIRQHYHGMWIKHKEILYPNGVFPLNLQNNSDEDFNIGVTNDITESFTDSKDKSAIGTNMLQSETASSGFFNNLREWGKIRNPYKISSRGEIKKIAYIGSPESEHSQQFKNFKQDLVNRFIKLFVHIVQASSIMLLSFVKVADSKKYFKIGCDNLSQDNSKASTLQRLLIMNFLEPVRWAKMAGPIIGITIGTLYLLNSNSLIYFKLNNEKEEELTHLFNLFMILYVIYQVFLFLPLMHDSDIGNCIHGLLWKEGESVLIIIAIILALCLTKFSFIFLVKCMLTLPFIIFTINYLSSFIPGFDKTDFKQYVFDNPESGFQNIVFTVILIISAILFIIEFIDTITTYYHVSGIVLFIQKLMQGGLFIAGMIFPVFLLVWHFFSVNKELETIGSPNPRVVSPKSQWPVMKKLESLIKIFFKPITTIKDMLGDGRKKLLEEQALVLEQERLLKEAREADDGAAAREARAMTVEALNQSETYTKLILDIKQFDGWADASPKTQQTIIDGISRIFAQEQENKNRKKMIYELTNSRNNIADLLKIINLEK